MTTYGPWLASAIDAYFTGKTVKAMLMNASVGSNPDLQYRSSLTASEVTGTGYTAGGVVVSGLTITYDAAVDRVKITCSPVTFSGTVDTVAGITFYVSTGDAATDPLLWNEGFPPMNMQGSLTYQPNAAGAVTIALPV